MDTPNLSAAIVQKLLKARQDYYLGKQCEFTDAEFDRMEETLRASDPTNAYFTTVGFNDSHADVKHKIPMLSQQKALTDEAAFNWIAKHIGEASFYADEPLFSLLAKLDGISCSLTYTEGILTQAVTRGDNFVGRDVTKKALNIPSIPQKLEYPFNGEVRGEIVFDDEGFMQVNENRSSRGQEPYANRRNGIAGLINEETSSDSDLACAEFIAFRALGGTAKFHTKQMKTLDRLGFTTPQVVGCSNLSQVENALRGFEEWRLTSPIEWDGVVISINSIELYEAAGFTDHHPIGAIAWKFKPMEGNVKCTDIEWSVGTKYLTPVAVFDPITLDGASICRVSLKSIGNMCNLGIAVGSTFKLVRSGGVIPWAQEASENRASAAYIHAHHIPNTCPVCSAELVRGAMLSCPNPSCTGKFARKIEIFAKSLGMDHFGPAACEALSNFVHRFSHLYSMTQHDLSVAGFTPAIAARLLAEINKFKSFELVDFITALSIPKVGAGTAAKLAAEFKTLDAIFNLTPMDFLSAPDLGMSSEAFSDLCKELTKLKPEVEALKMFIEVKGSEVIELAGDCFKDLQICITGPLSMNRNQWIKKIIENGGKFVNSVSRNTSILITNVEEDTSKYKNAVKFKIPIHKEQWLFDKLHGAK